MSLRPPARFTRPLLCFALLFSAWPGTAGAQAVAAADEIDIGNLLQSLREQGSQIDAQADALAGQAELIRRQQALLLAQTDAIRALQTRVDQLAARDGGAAALSDEEQSIRARLESLEREATSTLAQEETTTSYDEETFAGAFAIPGSSAALRIGGFVKMNVVQSLSALGSQNRFIVGTIPTRGPGGSDPEAVLTVQQSRLDLELRENTDFGQFRGFVEGDFAGAGDTFRLRHAFGQFRDWMAGKTWSTFMDTRAAPEEVDFEGVNGRINVRQPQIRWFPAIGRDWDLELAMEDPAPDITGGAGLSQIPDFVASIRRTPPLVDQAWQVKTSFLFRTLRARWDVDPNRKEEALGWALSVSARRPFPRWNPRDSVSLQLSYGDGYGRYVNDLSTVGGQDAVFDDTTGALETLPVFAAYLSFEKWWRDGLRSTFIASFVDVDNPDFQPGDAYRRTQRISSNLIWSPVPRVDVGGELLWGKREDKDGSTGDASQFQLSVRYRF
jgi:hypothetical protein